MKRLMMLAAAGLMALMLGACGQNEPKQPEVAAPDAAMDQSKDQAAPEAKPEEQKTEEQKPSAQATPADVQEQAQADVQDQAQSQD